MKPPATKSGKPAAKRRMEQSQAEPHGADMLARVDVQAGANGTKNAGTVNPPRIALRMEAELASVPFAVTAGISDSEQVIAGEWLGKEEEKPELTAFIRQLAKQNNVEAATEILSLLPPITLEKLGFSYAVQRKALAARLTVQPFGSMRAMATLADPPEYAIALEPGLFIPLSSLPVLKSIMAEGDGIELQALKISSSSQGIGVAVNLMVTLGGSRTQLVLGDSGPDRSARSQVDRGVLDGDASDKPLLPPDSAPSKIFWVDAQKKFSIFSLNKIGFGLSGPNIALYLDAGFELGPIAVTFYELKLGTSLKNFKDVSFGLSGLAVSMEKPPLTLSGGLYRDGDQNLYSGEIMVGFGKYLLTALGSYGVMPSGTHTLFVYLVLHAELGGPPFLFVTGVAGGFGLNRRLVLPENVNAVETFPFVAAAMGGQGAKTRKPAEMLKELGEKIRPEDGSYFGSVGLRFTSFGLLDSFVLLNVEFGQRLRISALGLSRLSIPPKVAKDQAIAYACLAVRALFSPDDGVFSVVGVLSNDSFVLDKNCKLTGGFACYVWNKGEHAGDFVITFGGYHPAFTRPAHYPAVPPLGISWNITNNLTLRGNIYFALTPSSVMAGGQLSIAYEQGNLKAWLNAYAHFLMQWKPFYYDIRIGISIGASYRISFLFIKKTLTIELGASLHIWGPEFRGNVRISWFIISFTINFGNQSPIFLPALSWSEFRTNFLSQESVPQLCRIQICGGISGEIKGSDGQIKSYLVKPEELAFQIESRLPLAEVKMGKNPLLTVANKKIKLQDSTRAILTPSEIALHGDVALPETPGIKPMKLSSFQASLNLTLDGDSSVAPMHCLPITANEPLALWGQPEYSPIAAVPKANATIKVLKGGLLRPMATKPAGHLPMLNGQEESYDLETLTANQKIDCHGWRWNKAEHPQNRAPKGDAFVLLAQSITQDAVAQKRARIGGLCGLGEIRIAKAWGTAGNEFLFARPVLRTTGARSG